MYTARRGYTVCRYREQYVGRQPVFIVDSFSMEDYRMIVIYTQDETLIRSNLDEAKNVILSIYGEKLGEKAYTAIKNAREGVAFRENGGPLVQVVTREKAEEIRIKETSIGMMK